VMGVRARDFREPAVDVVDKEAAACQCTITPYS
jgi:hypothetical protein